MTKKKAEAWQYVCRRCWCAIGWGHKSRKWYHLGPEAPGSCKRRGLEPEPMKRSVRDAEMEEMAQGAKDYLLNRKDFDAASRKVVPGSESEVPE